MTSIFISKTARRGVTMVEMMVVVGAVTLLAGLLIPSLANVRNNAKKIQCTSQLRQIYLALTMYDMDHDRDLENYPDRLTHLVPLGYIANPKIFICPMDYTKAIKDGLGVTTLKPGMPKDNKADWAERWGVTSNGMPESNCSYLYEFSTRTCEVRDPATSDWPGVGWAENVLVEWDEYGTCFYVTPDSVDRDGDGIITWQEAKFWQLNNGDGYVSGYYDQGESDDIPYGWYFPNNPYQQINTDYTADVMRSYPRSWLPMLRCFWHVTPSLVDDETNEGILNLAVDGNTFYSSPGWEQTAWKYGHTVPE